MSKAPIVNNGRAVAATVVVTVVDQGSELNIDGADTFDYHTVLTVDFNWQQCRKLIVVGIPQPSMVEIYRHAKTIFTTDSPRPDHLEYAEWELTDGMIVAVMGRAYGRGRVSSRTLEVELKIGRPLRKTPPPY